MKNFKIILATISSIFLLRCSTVEEISLSSLFNQKTESIKQSMDSFNQVFELPPKTKLENVSIDSSNSLISIEFSKSLAVVPLREDNVNEIYKLLPE